MCLANEEVTVASKRDEQHGISRREFASRVGAAAASIAIGGQFFDSAVHATSPSAHVSGRVIGANDRVVTASIGIRGQGNSLKRGFAKLKNVEIKTLDRKSTRLLQSRLHLVCRLLLEKKKKKKKKDIAYMRIFAILWKVGAYNSDSRLQMT